LSKSRARILKSKVLFTGRVFGVRRDIVIEPDGLRTTREYVTHPGSVVVMPVLPGGRVVLIRQYRHATGGYLWEFVAGRIEPGESPLVSARRELLEETGYTARRYRKLLDVFPTPGFLTERMIIFAAEGLTAGTARPEDDERIETRIFSTRQLEVMIQRGTLRDTKSIAAELFYLRFIRKSAR
jgi:ADP-ribose pyrophosphatase